MAEIVAGFLGPAIEVVKWVGAPIIRQFNYLCCCVTNITTLKHEAQKLEVAAADLQGQIDRARDNAQLIVPQVETWLTTSNDIKQETNGILNEARDVESGCLELRASFSISRRAKKTIDRMKDLRDKCKFEAISQAGPLPETRAVSLGMTYRFESRIEEDIMTTLRGEDVNMIGIYGMGGVGKTTMAKRIMNRALEEQLFEEIAMASISQHVDMLRIQDDIGGLLGLKLEGETSEARVQRLHTRLSGTRRLLLVLDDVWETLICRLCGLIEELPPEMKGLNHLKLLDLTMCQNLQRIGPGIISSLVGLEELKMLGSFNKWEAGEGSERENAALRELESLTNLTCLEIEIADPTLVAEKMYLPSKLEIFEIRIISDFKIIITNKEVRLHWERGTSIGHWIQKHRLRDTESLFITGNGANNLDLAKSKSIRCLELGKYESMKNGVRTSMDDDGRYGGATMFPYIEDLHIFCALIFFHELCPHTFIR